MSVRWRSVRRIGVITGLGLAGIFSIIVALTRAPSLDDDQLVSVSAPPEQGPEYTPYFSLCDSIPCSCECDDPFDPRLFGPPESPFAEQCLNTRIRRSVRTIEAVEAVRNGYFPTAADTDGFIYIANVYHEDSTSGESAFYVARVDTGRLRDVVLQVEYAGGIQGHAQLRFRFRTPEAVTFVPQRTTVEREPFTRSDLFYSVEAQAPAGVPYKGDYGFRRVYVQTHRMATLYARARVMIKVLNRPVWQFPLDGKRISPSSVFHAALEQSQSADVYERYHTTQNNCALKLYDVLDRAHPPAWYRRPILWITDQTLFMPTRAKRHLWYRGLLGADTLENMELELGWEIVHGES